MRGPSMLLTDVSRTAPVERGATAEDDRAHGLLKEASRLFRERPMPLQLCLALRGLTGKQSTQPDSLANAFRTLALQPERLRTGELQHLIDVASLGGWALSGETIDCVMTAVQMRRPSTILEFGSGTSSLALAWVMRRLHGPSTQPYVFSIDQSSEFISRTKELLARHGLLECVRFLHADLVPHAIGGISTRCYDLPPRVLESFFGKARPETVLIDGPAGENGVRFGTVPLVRNYVAPDASIYLDDALRDSELDTADLWSRLGYVQWEGLRWIGKGLLCGTMHSELSPEMQEWFGMLQSLMNGHGRSAPATPPCTENPADGGQEGIRSERRAIEQKSVRESTDANAVRETEHNCIFLNTYYPGFLEHHYKQHPELAGTSYVKQRDLLQAACFGDSDFYSSGLCEAGWKASDVIVNCRPLQQQWAKEHGIDPQQTSLAIALEQIKRARPPVLYLQDLGIGTQEFLSAVRAYADIIVGQIASPVPPQAYLDGFDILISSFPHFVEEFRRQGRTAYYQPLAFDPRVLTRLGNPARRFPLTFVGGLSPAHRERQELLTSLGISLPLHLWGYGTQALQDRGIEPSRLHGDAWGLEMFSVLTESLITVNHHIDVAQMNANNMRLFEATGCGALLVTDYKDNLSDLFEIGREVVAYRSPDECRELIQYYLGHRDEASTIAKRGQERTLRDHTYQARMRHTAEILARQVGKKIGGNRLPDPDLGRVSYGRTAIRPDQVTPELTESWRSDLIPLKQRALVETELREMYRGNPPPVFQVLAEALQPYARPNVHLLEVGCASGYYSEALEYLLKTRMSYIGVDFSDAMIRMARTYYPHARFEVGDGASLRFADRSIPIVVSSCVLLHVQEYATHIAEAARVASEIVILHRTPVARRSPTKHFKKFAYGVETFELRFSEAEILRLCDEAGLELLSSLTYHERPDQDEFETTYVFSTPRSR